MAPASITWPAFLPGRFHGLDISSHDSSAVRKERHTKVPGPVWHQSHGSLLGMGVGLANRILKVIWSGSFRASTEGRRLPPGKRPWRSRTLPQTRPGASNGWHHLRFHRLADPGRDPAWQEPSRSAARCPVHRLEVPGSDCLCRPPGSRPLGHRGHGDPDRAQGRRNLPFEGTPEERTSRGTRPQPSPECTSDIHRSRSRQRGKMGENGSTRII